MENEMEKMTETITIAKEFSAYPAGRFPTDGKYNGEAFRKNFLVPVLKAGKSIIIVLDGLESFADSFFDEAFGGLSREEGFSAEDVRNRITVTSHEVINTFFTQAIKRHVMHKTLA